MRTLLIVLVIAIPLWMTGVVFVWSLCRMAALSDRAARRQMEHLDD